MWRGRKQLGQELLIGVQCQASAVPTAPDAAPTYRVYTEAGTLVTSGSLPPMERYTATGLFTYMLPLNSLFSVGRHYIRYSFQVSSTTYTADLDTFEIVAGGNTDGQYNALFYLDRPDGNDYILGTTSQGTMVVNRGPKV